MVWTCALADYACAKQAGAQVAGAQGRAADVAAGAAPRVGLADGEDAAALTAERLRPTASGRYSFATATCSFVPPQKPTPLEKR